MSEKPIDVEKWAEQTKRGSIPVCGTCSQSQDVLDAVRLVLQLIIKGKSNVSIKQLHMMLKDKFKYPFGYDALKNHIAHHESELWRKVNAKK